MDKRNTGKEKLRNNKHFPYKKTRVHPNFRMSEDYFVIGAEEKEFIESFRLKSTALTAAQGAMKKYGRAVLVVTASEYKEMCHDQKGVNK